MELQDIYFVAEIVGVIAIVGSLLFVGVQMRQNTNALKASVANDMVATWQSVMEPFCTDPGFIEAINFFRNDKEGAEPTEEQFTRVFGFYSPSFKNCEFAYYRYLAGELDEGLWLGIRNGALDAFGSHMWTSQIWPALRIALSPQFARFMEKTVVDGAHKKLQETHGASMLS